MSSISSVTLTYCRKTRDCSGRAHRPRSPPTRSTPQRHSQSRHGDRSWRARRRRDSHRPLRHSAVAGTGAHTAAYLNDTGHRKFVREPPAQPAPETTPRKNCRHPLDEGPARFASPGRPGWPRPEPTPGPRHLWHRPIPVPGPSRTDTTRKRGRASGPVANILRSGASTAHAQPPHSLPVSTQRLACRENTASSDGAAGSDSAGAYRSRSVAAPRCRHSHRAMRRRLWHESRISVLVRQHVRWGVLRGPEIQPLQTFQLNPERGRQLQAMFRREQANIA